MISKHVLVENVQHLKDSLAWPYEGQWTQAAKPHKKSAMQYLGHIYSCILATALLPLSAGKSA